MFFIFIIVIVMKTTADDASSSCNVDSRSNETVETVGVNNCVNNNILNSNTIINNHNNEAIVSDKTSDIDCMQLVDYLAVELLDDVKTMSPMMLKAGNNNDDKSNANNDDGGGDGGPKKTVKNNLIINDDDDMQSNYLKSNESIDIIKASSWNNLNLMSSKSPTIPTTTTCSSSSISYSASTPISALSQNTQVLPKGTYTVTRENNKNHRNAVRKNFSLWIGVTSCVWGLLVLLLKNYSD